MATLSSDDIDDIEVECVRVNREAEGIPLTKAQLRAAIVATDGWVNDNKASANNALPAEAKANLSAKQKAKILRFVIAKRWIVDA